MTKRCRRLTPSQSKTLKPLPGAEVREGALGGLVERPDQADRATTKVQTPRLVERNLQLATRTPRGAQRFLRPSFIWQKRESSTESSSRPAIFLRARRDQSPYIPMELWQTTRLGAARSRGPSNMAGFVLVFGFQGALTSV